MVPEAPFAAFAVAVVGPLATLLVLLRAAGHLPPTPVVPLTEGVLAVGAVGSALAYPALPEAGLVAPPVVVVPVAVFAFAGVVRVRPHLDPFWTGVAGAGAVGAGLAVFFARGILRFGPEFVGHAVRPPSLLAASVALAVVALAFFPLGRAAALGAPRWPFALPIAALPAATVAAAAWRPFNFAGLVLPVVLAIVAVLLGVPLFRLGHATALAAPRPERRRR